MYSKKMDAPTEEEIVAVMKQAEDDGFEGKPGVTRGEDGKMKISYRASKGIKWSAGGHSFGSGE